MSRWKLNLDSYLQLLIVFGLFAQPIRGTSSVSSVSSVHQMICLVQMHSL